MPLADHLIPLPASNVAARRRRLLSANLNHLTMPRCRLSTYGCRAFLLCRMSRQSGTRFQMNLEVQTALRVLNGFWKQFCSVATSVTGALQAFSNDMRYISLRFTYLLRWWHSVVVSTLGLFNVINRHWVRLLLGSVTVYGQVNRLGMWPAT